MSTKAMSSAEKIRQKAASCLHVSSYLLDLFHRAKPVSEKERSGFERALRPRSRKLRRACPISR